MADSKITQLPLSPYALDKDYIIAVTGHLEDGNYPYNTKMPLSYIRRYIVRPNLLINANSGISGYYHSGLNILNLGLDIQHGEGIGYNFESEPPHKYKIFTTEKVKYSNTDIDIHNTGNYTSGVTYGNNLLTLDYSDFYQSKKNQTLSLLGTACFKINNISFSGRPFAPDADLNDQKISELLAISGTTYNYNSSGCLGDSESCSPISIPQSITWSSGHLANFTQDSFNEYYQNTFTLTIGISGEGSDGLISNIHSHPITFSNTTQGTSTPYYNDDNSAEYYRQNQNPYVINGVDPMVIMSKVNLSISSNIADQYNSLSLCAFISNVRGKRVWTNSVDLVPSYSCDINCNTINPINNTYSYETTKCYCDTSASIKMIFIKAENIVS